MKPLRIFIGLIVISFVAACALQPTPLEELTGRVDYSVASALKGLKVVSISDVAAVNEDGTFEANVPDEGINIVMALAPGAERPVLMGVKFGKELYRPSLAKFTLRVPELDAESTALALVMLDPFFVGVSDSSRADMAEVIVNLPEFQDLVEAIDSALRQDPLHALDARYHPEIYAMAADILPRALEEKFGTAQIKFRRAGVSVDQSLPWVECLSADSIRFYNPTMVYYWADIVSYDFQNGGAACADPSNHFLLPKTRFYDLTCVFDDISCVLDLFQVPEEATDMSSFPPGDAKLVAMYKGFGSRTIGDVECGAKSAAMMANLWQSIKYILTLATSAGNLLPEGHLVVSGLMALMDETQQAQFREALNSMDIWTVIDYVINIIMLFKDDIVSYLSDSFGGDAANTFLSAASSVLGDVFKFASMAYELTSRTGPYFYDLITAGEYSAYFVDPDGGCLVDAMPLIVKLMPAVLSPGGKLVILGFFFGSEQGTSKVYVGGVEAVPLFWSDNSITVGVPLNIQSNEIYVVVNGKQSNVVRARIKTSRGGDDGGGGCAMAAQDSDTSPLYALVFLMPLAFGFALRRGLRKM